MRIRELRLRRLADFIGQNESVAALARKYPKVDPSYISQLLSGERGFGDRAARNMEERCGLPEGYFDIVDENQVAITSKEVMMLKFIRMATSDEMRDEILLAMLMTLDKNGLNPSPISSEMVNHRFNLKTYPEIERRKNNSP